MCSMTVLRERLIVLIEPLLERLGYELVELEYSAGRAHGALRLFIDKAEGVGVGDCERVSREVSALLDVEDPIAGAYSLEVSSPGIDRPLTRPKDYERFLGHEAKVETNAPIDGRKRFKGPIKSVDANAVELTVEGADIRVPFGAVHKAKLVLTDALIALHQATEDNNEQEEA